MSRKALPIVAGVILALSAGSLVQGQTTTTTVTQTPTTVTKTVQHPDGTYTVIEYPVGKEVKIALDPVALQRSKGVATILRDENGTRVVLNVSDVPADVTAISLYAVDDTGAVTLLGPIEVANGAGTLTTTTPLSKFMLIASPEATLKAYDPNTKVFFRSSVPEGFAVVPHGSTGERDGAAVGERVSATTTAGATSATSYKLPMLNIPGFRRGTDTEMKIKFSGAMTGSRANVIITPRKDGPSEVKVRFHELKETPAGQVYVVWAVSPDNKFVKLGQIVNAPGRNEAEIRSETALMDFGLLVTMEDAVGSSANPLGPAIGVVEIVN
ncbi:MAG: anti-sigma factor [Pyrinomonadaceae bacterium]|nr:anti-sigma factor [Pyrinomonadaceae bacterium]